MKYIRILSNDGRDSIVNASKVVCYESQNGKVSIFVEGITPHYEVNFPLEDIMEGIRYLFSETRDYRCQELGDLIESQKKFSELINGTFKDK